MQSPVSPTLYITKQAIYHCANCDHVGVAERVPNPWRWWHYPLLLVFFPFGLLYVLSSTSPTKRCAKCHALKIKRVRTEQLPKPPPLPDSNPIRTRRERWIGLTILLAIFLIPFFVGFWQGWQEAKHTSENQAAQQAAADAANAILQADYAEGYKAGYADGRSALGKLADSFDPPATEERAASYAEGYITAFKLGCDEGGFDCAEQLRLLEEESNFQ